MTFPCPNLKLFGRLEISALTGLFSSESTSWPELLSVPDSESECS